MKKKIYLDYAASTPVAPAVIEAMLPYLGEIFGNASSVHGFGLGARQALDTARTTIAEALHAATHEIVFTSGGTEANNLAIEGVARAHSSPGHLITTPIEHKSVRQACVALQKRGWQLTILPVDEWGLVQPADLADAIRDDTALISIMFANNEVGTIQPIAELAEIARRARVPMHTDAVQAFGKLEIDVSQLPVSLLSIAAHKIYGPKGAGALFVRRGTRIAPVLLGGDQEHKLRAGTENVPAIAGFARAVELALERRQRDVRHAQELARRFMAAIERELPRAVMNGHREQRLPNILNYSFPGHDSMALLMGLDLQGIAASNGSACSVGSVQPSKVLQAMHLSRSRQVSALRFSFGRPTTPEEIDLAVAALKSLMQRPATAPPRKAAQT